MGEQCRCSYRTIGEALKAIQEIVLRIHSAECYNKQSSLKLNEGLMNELLKERENCEHKKSQIKETRKNRLENADQRNIKHNQYASHCKPVEWYMVVNILPECFVYLLDFFTKVIVSMI